jgi:hypothetical protein
VELSLKKRRRQEPLHRVVAVPIGARMDILTSRYVVNLKRRKGNTSAVQFIEMGITQVLLPLIQSEEVPPAYSHFVEKDPIFIFKSLFLRIYQA